MRKLLGWALLSAGMVSAIASVRATSRTASNTVRVLEIRSTINPATADFLLTTIQKAEDEGAQFVLLELDTPGGLVSSVREMAQAIDRSSVPVVVYTAPAGASATSAGALLSLASHVAAMAPGTAIGAAHPVSADGKDIGGGEGQGGSAMKEKAVQDTAAFARGLAELRGRNTELAEQVVAKSKSFTANEALERKLIEVIANDRADLLRKLDGREIKIKAGVTRVLRTAQAPIAMTEMTLGQKILNMLANPNIAALLMSLGLLCIYVEITTAGFGVAGVVGAIVILIAFMSFQLLPIRMGGVLLLGLGAVMLIAEAFVASGGILAVGGAVAFVLGLIWIMDPTQTSLVVSPAVWIPIAIALGLGAIGVGWVLRRLKARVERARRSIGGGGPMGLEGYEGHVSLISDDGRSGKVSIRGEVWDFESAEALRVGDAVRVLQQAAGGFKVRVERK